MTENAGFGNSGDDPLLSGVPELDGFKVLDSCVLYGALGRGGMGAVYRARHLKLDIDVAVKCLLRDLAAADPQILTRFRREARVAASINDPRLVRVFEVGEMSGLNYLVMELVEGETLRGRVLRSGPLPVGEAVGVVLEAARGLATAHAQGSRPPRHQADNIMISRAGEVKVADLGLARVMDEVDARLTATSALLGTPQYMPPEQFRSASDVGPTGDVYALGATLYYLLVGAHGIPSAPLSEMMFSVINGGFPALDSVRPDLPIALSEFIAEATRPDPVDRMPDAAAMVRELESRWPEIAGSDELSEALGFVPDLEQDSFATSRADESDSRPHQVRRQRRPTRHATHRLRAWSCRRQIGSEFRPGPGCAAKTSTLGGHRVDVPRPGDHAGGGLAVSLAQRRSRRLEVDRGA